MMGPYKSRFRVNGLWYFLSQMEYERTELCEVIDALFWRGVERRPPTRAELDYWMNHAPAPGFESDLATRAFCTTCNRWMNECKCTKPRKSCSQ